MIILIDNYDSFVHNLARYLQRLGQETLVLRNDATTPADVRRLAPQAIIISPGPCTPQQAGCSVSIVRELAPQIPILGVCLGHQAIAEALGAAHGTPVVRAPEPRHGRTSQITHDSSSLFAGVPSPFSACRYHSLTIDEATLPADLRVTAYAEDGCVMALAHATWPLFGLQFHPEAVLTEHGYRILANFLELAGCRVTADVAVLAASERPVAPPQPSYTPATPVTF